MATGDQIAPSQCEQAEALAALRGGHEALKAMKKEETNMLLGEIMPSRGDQFAPQLFWEKEVFSGPVGS